MVADRAAGSMLIELEVYIEATPERVFSALTAEVDAWWTYTFHPRSTVRLEPHAGGRFVETWENGELVFATVLRAKPGVLLSMTGPMGMDSCVEGIITFTLVASRGGTTLSLMHRAAGELPEKAEAQYRAGWETLLLGCFHPYIERDIVPSDRRRTE